MNQLQYNLLRDGQQVWVGASESPIPQVRCSSSDFYLISKAAEIKSRNPRYVDSLFTVVDDVAGDIIEAWRGGFKVEESGNEQ